MNTMDLNDIQALLSALVDGEIDQATRHRAERLMAQCDEARKLMDEAEALDALIAVDAELLAGESVGLPDDFEREVLARTVYTNQLSYGQRWTTWAGWVAAAACLAMAITIYVMDRRAWIHGGFEPGGQVATTDGSDSNGVDREMGAASTMAANFTRRSWTIDTPLDQPNPHAPELPERRPIAGSSEVAGILKQVPPMEREAFDAQFPAEQSHDRTQAARTVVLAERDALALQSAAMLLAQLEMAETDTFRDIDLIRRAAEYDRVVAGLAAARGSVAAVDRPLVLAAESIFMRLVRGPLSTEDADLLRDDAIELGIARQLERILEQSAIDRGVLF